jgi:N-acetylmuramoyl-L-alanine amidase
MKRLIPVVILAAASIVLAQAPNQATLRTPSGDRVISVTHLGAQTMFAADEVIGALGGAVSAEGNGFKAAINSKVAAFGPDSRFAVVGEDLIEMPVAPVSVENRPFVPWQFFQGFLSKSNDFDVTWDAAARVLAVRPAQHNAVTAQVSVANVQGVSKVVVTLSAPAEYTIVKEQQAYTIHFKSPVQAPFTDQTYEDPNVTKASFTGSDMRIDLAAGDVVADAYRLDNPFRVVLDLHKGAAAPAGSIPAVTRPRQGGDSPGIHTIVIDPGHGGKDVGAVGPAGLQEKDATLALCRKLADALEAKLKTRVILTRTDDSVVPLDQRTAIANQYQADLFLSVHMNAAVVKGAHGSETYFLSLEASDELAKNAAEMENASARLTNATTSADLKLILWDLAQHEYLKESQLLAADVQEAMNRATNVASRGVKQAPFKVLVGATMPAALVEVAFISNPDEESKLKNDAFVASVVTALTTAIEKYKGDFEARIGVSAPATPALSTGTPVTPPKKAGQ